MLLLLTFSCFFWHSIAHIAHLRHFCILCTRPKSCFGGLNERWAATLFWRVLSILTNPYQALRQKHANTNKENYIGKWKLSDWMANNQKAWTFSLGRMIESILLDWSNIPPSKSQNHFYFQAFSPRSWCRPLSGGCHHTGQNNPTKNWLQSQKLGPLTQK